MELTICMNGFGQMFGVPNAVVDQYLKLATPSQLKVLLYLLRNSGRQVDTAELAQALTISGELAEEAVLFWQQTELFAPTQESHTKEKAEPKSHARRTNQIVPLSSARNVELSPVEIATALKDSDDLRTLFHIAEQQLGRPLRYVEQKSLVWMHDYNNIGNEIILTVLTYCKDKLDKPSVSYAETVATAWWNDGIQTLPQVSEVIKEAEHRRTFTGHIQKTFEMRRMPTPKQQEFIDAWQEQNIPIELITYAYEKNIENIEKLSFPYINGVLTRWMEAGYRTREDVDKYDCPADAGDPKSPRSGKGKAAASESGNAQAYMSLVCNPDE